MNEEKSILDAAVEALVDAVQTLDEVKDALWAVALELDQINDKLKNITDENGALRVNIDYEKLGDQLAAALGQSVVETSTLQSAEFPAQKKVVKGAK